MMSFPFSSRAARDTSSQPATETHIVFENLPMPLLPHRFQRQPKLRR
jgi:hypothetical protein